MPILTLKADSGSWTEAFNLFHDGQVTIDTSQLPDVLQKFFFDNVIMKPFAGYKDFDACVRTVSHRKNPPSDVNAYCASIMHSVEGKKNIETVGEYSDYTKFHKVSNFVEGKDVIFGIKDNTAKAIMIYLAQGSILDQKCDCMKEYSFKSESDLEDWLTSRIVESKPPIQSETKSEPMKSIFDLVKSVKIDSSLGEVKEAIEILDKVHNTEIKQQILLNAQKYMKKIGESLDE